MGKRERRIARVASVLVQVLEVHPRLAWETVVAVNRGTGWLREGPDTGDQLDEIGLRMAWNLAREIRGDGPDSMPG